MDRRLSPHSFAVRRIVIALAAAAALIAPAAGLRAQTAAELQQRYRDAFRTTYANPADLQAALSYARLAEAVGDYEGAIGALERIFYYAPDQPEIAFELGRLYYRLGSFDAARSWYQKALAGNLPAADRRTAERELAATEAQTQRQQITGTLTTGFTYQSNANAGPNAIAGLSSGTFTAPKSDGAVFAAASVTHRYDLERQDGSTFDSHLALYGARQFRLHTLNVLFAEVDIGPRFILGSFGMPETSIRPYLIGSAFGLGNSLYFAGGGLGTRVATRIGSSLSLAVPVEVRGFSFHNFASQPQATDRNGGQLISRIELLYMLTPVDQIGATLQGVFFDARRAYESYEQVGLSMSYARQFPGLWGGDSPAWVATLVGGGAVRPYAGINSAIDSTTRRRDRELTVAATLQAPITPQWYLQTQVAQLWSHSRLAVYTYSNTTVSLAVGYSF